MSQYLEALRQEMVIYPMIVVLFAVPYIAWSYHKYGSVLSLRVLIVYSFLLYLLCVYCLVILPLPTPPVFFSCRYSQASRNPTWTACQLASHFHRQRLLDNHFQSIYDDAVLVKRRASSTPSRLASSGVISPGTKDCRRW